MDVTTVPEPVSAEPPLFVSVVEAARLLGIGRTLAYQLVDAWRAGDPQGLPGWMIGGCLRVPRWAIDEMTRYGRVISVVRSEASAIIDAGATAVTSSTRSRHGSSRVTAQLSLLDRA